MQRTDFYISGDKRSSIKWDSNPEPLSYRASVPTTKLMIPDILTDIHTPVDPVTYKPIVNNTLKFLSVGDWCRGLEPYGGWMVNKLPTRSTSTANF